MFVKHKLRLLGLLIILCFMGSNLLLAQNNEQEVITLLDSLAIKNPALNNEVDISVSDIPIKELVRILGNTTGLNVSIDPTSSVKVNSNFNKVKAKDVISFLCNNYNLQLDPYGSILYLKPIARKAYSLELDYLDTDSILSYSSENTDAQIFFEELTKKTDQNFMLSPSVKNIKINGFGQNILLGSALEQIAQSNDLSIQKNSTGLYLVAPRIKAGKDVELGSVRRSKPVSLSYMNGAISLTASDNRIVEVLKSLEEQSHYHVLFLNAIDDKVSMNLSNLDINSFLKRLFYGSENTYKFDGNSIYIGKRNLPELKTCELIRLNNRRVDSLVYVLPKALTAGLSVEEFHEQNSLIVWGDADKIYDFKNIINDIDLPVPVILIDVIIIDSSKSFGVETGLEIGLGEAPVETKGVVNPGIDYTMNASSTNKLLNRIGLTNLGRVSPNFYMNLRAMESDGIIDIRSTPQLSTMNGHSASMSVGQTEYYKEELSNIWGTQNPQLQTQSQFKPVEAKLEVIIKPFVTGNGNVSLDINVLQSEFTARISENAPPGLVAREFKSKINVKNQEMILLGGLEENTNRVTSSGLPLLSRIPILKWIFSSRSDTKEKRHLNIFIKPTVFY